MARLNALRLSRSTDRDALAASLTALAATHGATCERWTHDRMTSLTFTLRGARACIGIDGDIRLGLPIISWVAPSGVGQCFGRAFENVVGSRASANLHHKATSIPEDLEGLAADLDEGLALIAAGEAAEFFVHPWAADTAWIAAGRPEPKAEWVAHYRATGESLAAREAA